MINKEEEKLAIGIEVLRKQVDILCSFLEDVYKNVVDSDYDGEISMEGKVGGLPFLVENVRDMNEWYKAAVKLSTEMMLRDHSECPDCGELVTFVEDEGGYRQQCFHCGFVGPRGDTIEEAVLLVLLMERKKETVATVPFNLLGKGK